MITPKKFVYALCAFGIVWLGVQIVDLVQTYYGMQQALSEARQTVSEQAQDLAALTKALAQSEAAQKAADAAQQKLNLLQTEYDTMRETILKGDKDDAQVAPVLRDTLRSLGLQ